MRYNADAALAGFGPGGFLRTFDWRQTLSEIKCPTCITVGAEDWINRVEQAKEMSQLISKSQLTIIPDSGHFVWVDQKERYFSTIINFLSTINFNHTSSHE